MPVIARKKPAAGAHQLHLGPSVGGASDFWTLAYCPELDEIEREQNPEHTEFTYILRYQLPLRTVVARVPKRLDGLWQRADGTLWAVGDSMGYIEISPAGVVEVGLGNVPGQFFSIWGADDDHVFAVGGVEPFVLYYARGKWSLLPLPDGAEDLRDVRGLSEQDVYFVGDHGQIHHFDGHVVRRLKVPARHHLTAITRLDATRVCVAGYQGTLIVGNGRGWRHLVTNTDDELLALATLDQKAYYGAEDRVWATDGASPPAPAIDFAARWLSELSDGLVISHEEAAKLYTAGQLTDLDLTI